MAKKLVSLFLCFLFSLCSLSYAEDYSNLTDLTIEKAIRITLENSREIKSAFEETVRADLQIMEATSGAFPQLNGQVEYDKNLKPQIFVISMPDDNGNLKKSRLKMGTDHQMSMGATLTQPLYVGGKVGTAVKAAKLYKKYSFENKNTVEQNVLMNVSIAFNKVLLAQDLVKINEASLAQSQRHLDNVEKLYKVGKATEYDLLRARVNLSNIMPTLVEARNNVNLALLSLKEIMGIPPDAPITINGAFDKPDSTLVNLVKMKTILDNRPDYRAAELNLDLRDKAIKIAKGDFLPTLSAGSTFAYYGNFDIFTYTAGDWSPYWYANLTLSFPIFTGFKNYSKYKQAKVDYRKAEIDLSKTKDSIQIEVDNSVMNMEKAFQQIDTQELTVKEAERAVELSESLYMSGKATQLEVLDAQLALDSARINLASALFDGKVAEISLKKGLGIIKAEK